ncbi:alpha-galactosidase [Paenibacillus terrigena]|uniref:alpha-galactosidase n=1 Tax=Paenibacillus terrigena TaxID=369333 RepID=UPI000369BA0D|nr:alpha-galactosidase [Paenibacillus terrigena]
MIKHDSERKIWVLEGDCFAYALGLSKTGTIVQTYFGEKLPYLSDYPEPELIAEYPYSGGSEVYQETFMGFGKATYTEPCLKATFEDGVRDLKLVFINFKISDSVLSFRMKDFFYPLEVILHYKIVPAYNLLELHSEIINSGSGNIQLEQVLSGSLYVPRDEPYRLTYLSGKWAGETQLSHTELPDTKLVLESRRGTTSHFTNPFFMLDRGGNSQEDHGEVYFGALAFSGNWKIVFEKDRLGMVKISAGTNDFDFAWNLKPGDNFVTPISVLGFVKEGFGAVSRNLHRYQREEVLPAEHRSSLRKVLYNSWEATSFDVNEDQQIHLAKIAASIGVELFVMDDGWFGARNSDRAGLGDWIVNPDKFPNDLQNLIQEVNALGMDFGLWIEPEMVNPDSDLYRTHPDWVYHFPTRDSTLIRNQLILNLARADVRQYLFESINRLLTDHNIRFIKWDMNRNFSEPGYPSAPREEQKEIWFRHAEGVYEIARKLKQAHPNVIFQSCSGGGGRVDLGILRYFDQVWTSDNTDAFDRLKIQEGFSYAYCSKIMESWVTDEVSWISSRKLTLAYRFHCAMMGNLGIGDNLLKWSPEEQQEARELIHLYKEIRHIVQDGDQYRLKSPSEGPLASVMYVGEQQEEAVVFVFLHARNFMNHLPRLRLKGLRGDWLYQIDGVEQLFSGQALMAIGIKLEFHGDFQSKVIRIRKVEAP